MDSGLIFPIIVALWAVYLVPQWIRRREDLSAAGSADRFSAAMRVLARDDQPAAEHRPASGSYVLTPPREDVVVRRARPVDTAPTRELAPSLLDHPELDHPELDHPELEHPDEGLRTTLRTGSGAGRGAGVPAGADSRAVATSRRSPVPGLLFLASLAALPVLTVLAVLGAVGAVWTLAPLLTGLVAMVALRRAAVRRAAARRAAARGRAARPRPRTRAVPAANGQGGHIPEFVAAPFGEADDATEPADESWTPVPVPPPTYTLKPQAPAARRVVHVEPLAEEPRPVPVPAAVQVEEPAAEQAVAVGAELSAGPVVAEPVRPAVRRAVPDLDLVLERRRASGE